MPLPPAFSSETIGQTVRFTLSGSWTIDASAALEGGASAMVDAAGTAQDAVFDLGHVERLDTAGAWLVDRSRRALAAKGIAARVERLKPEHRILIEEVQVRDAAAPPARGGFSVVGLLADIGEAVVEFGRDVYAGVAFLGELMASLGQAGLAAAAASSG